MVTASNEASLRVIAASERSDEAGICFVGVFRRITAQKVYRIRRVLF